MNSRSKLIISTVVILALLAGCMVIYPKLAIITGFSAKALCSCTFNSGIDQTRAEREELGFSLLWMASNSIDHRAKTVESHVLGLQRKKAVFRQGLGCTLILDKEGLSPIGEHSLDKAQLDFGPDALVDASIEYPELQQYITTLVETTQGGSSNTRAIVVLINGKVAAEAYASGIDSHTPLHGWSMSKSLTALMAGALAKDGKWQLETSIPLAQWSADKRRDITLRHLLEMTTGLEWEEEYGKVSTATHMLYNCSNMGAYAAEQQLMYEPGNYWQYSSGTTNILAYAMRPYFNSDRAYLEFIHRRIFGPLGAKSFIFETDASNHLVGSSYAYGSARDWAKIGQLLLNRGNWIGEQIVDTSWVDFMLTEVRPSNGQYGGQIWLNKSGKFKNYDTEAYWLGGHQGQQVSIHPKDSLVVVRLGMTNEASAFSFDDMLGEIKRTISNGHESGGQ